MNKIREALKDSRRIVIKVGTSTLTYDTGKVNFTRIDRLARVLSDLSNQGKEVVLVTSGAIGVGVDKLKLKEKPKLIPEKQAVAAVGQCELMHIYSKFFSDYGHIVGQILLTRDAVEDEHRRQNVINTFETLLQKEIIPIVNENDSVSVEEIKFGENDTLSAIVSKLIKADLLIILSDIDGLYESDPRNNPDAKMISVVESITPEIEKSAGGAGTKRGTGGMITKLFAAKIATAADVHMVIASGKNPDIVMDIINGKDIGTLFTSGEGKGLKEI
ncbi:MAG: glutamate 5-kinase [Clostridia bacterium]|nr:glutamate 5-kinase [Clostridia bacterium]